MFFLFAHPARFGITSVARVTTAAAASILIAVSIGHCALLAA